MMLSRLLSALIVFSIERPFPSSAAVGPEKCSSGQSTFMQCVMEMQYGEYHTHDITWLRLRLHSDYKGKYDLIQFGRYEHENWNRKLPLDNAHGDKSWVHWKLRHRIEGLKYQPIFRLAFDGRNLNISYLETTLYQYFRVHLKYFETKTYSNVIDGSILAQDYLDLKILRVTVNLFRIFVNNRLEIPLTINFLQEGVRQALINAVEAHRSTDDGLDKIPGTDFLKVFSTEYPIPYVARYAHGGFPIGGVLRFIAKPDHTEVIFIINHNKEKFWKITFSKDHLDFHHNYELIKRDGKFTDEYYADVTIKRVLWGTSHQLHIGYGCNIKGPQLSTSELKQRSKHYENAFIILDNIEWEGEVTDVIIERSDLRLLYVYDPGSANLS